MKVYTAIDGRQFDLDALSADERDYFESCLRQYRADALHKDFGMLVHTRQNPLVAAAGNRVTREVWVHPLFQILYDLDDRLGIAQKKLAAPGNADLRDPLRDSGDLVTTAEAAALKGVSVQTVHNAYRRGELLGEEAAKGARTVLRINTASLERWDPVEVRVKAGRASAAARTGSEAGAKKHVDGVLSTRRAAGS